MTHKQPLGESLRARRFPQENVVKQTRVGVSATYAYRRLGNRVRDLLQPRSVFRSFRKIGALVQIRKNPELFSPFFAFFGLNNLLPLTGMKYFGLQVFRLRAEKKYIIRLVNSKLVVKAVFSSMMHSSY